LEECGPYDGTLLMQYCFTNRFGGVSHAPYDSFNLGLHVNDNALHVNQNREHLRAQLGVSKLVFMDQVHSNEVCIITSGDEMPTCDAMITQQKDVGLVVMVADCIPILLYDAAHEAIGVAHAGRAGSRLLVGQKCALAMHEYFGSAMKNLQIMMGPSIQKCCYEVGMEATLGFESVLHVKDERYFLDLQRFNYEAFLTLGILKEHIVVSSTCSCCDATLFSYRREKDTGRFAGAICL